MADFHLIVVPKKSQYKRAIATLLGLPQSQYLALPDHQFVVNDEQLQALEQAKVVFRLLSQAPVDGQKAASVRS